VQGTEGFPVNDSIVTYARRPRAQRGLFAARFITLSSIGFVFGLACLLADGADLAISNAYGAQAGTLVFAACQVVLDAVLVAGCVGTWWRQAWAQRVLLLFARGQFVYVGVAFVALFLLQLVLKVPQVAPSATESALLFAGVVVRCAAAGAVLWMCRSLYADFYFGTARREESEPLVPLERRAVARRAAQRRAAQRRAPRFIVRGREVASGKDVEYTSHAATEDLAKLGAVALGLELESVRVVPVTTTENRPPDASVGGVGQVPDPS
jgi:hypothetical protein